MSACQSPSAQTLSRQMERALEMRAAGLTDAAIAAAFRTPTRLMIERFRRYGLEVEDRASKPKSRPWNARTDATLRRLWAEGVPILEMAKTMSRSKYSIISRVRRLALAPRPSPIIPKSARCEQVAKPVAPRPARKKVAAPKLTEEPAQRGPDPVWTKARQLAVARRIKARHCWDHIAADLCELPGPKVHVRDVLQYAGRVVAS